MLKTTGRRIGWLVGRPTADSGVRTRLASPDERVARVVRAAAVEPGGALISLRARAVVGAELDAVADARQAAGWILARCGRRSASRRAFIFLGLAETAAMPLAARRARAS